MALSSSTAPLSSATPCPIRTFCVIPHSVRDHAAFEAVQEDHVVFGTEAKLSTFDFSSVLSPAHNMQLNVVSPIIDAVRSKKNGALLVVTPPGSGEASTVAMDLFSNLLPLLFRAMPACSIAHVSAVEVKRGGKSVTDLYRMTPVTSLHEIEMEEVLRASAGTAWGHVMELFSQRGSWIHSVASFDASSSGSAGAEQGGGNCVIAQVQMEGYGTLIVGDMGSSTETLNLMTMALRGAECFGANRTHPPRVHLTRLLQPCIAPHGSSHVVVIPDPLANFAVSHRIMHFASNLQRDVNAIVTDAIVASPSGTPAPSEARWAMPVPVSTPVATGDSTSRITNEDSSRQHSWRDEIVHGLLQTPGGHLTSTSRQAYQPPKPTQKQSDHDVSALVHTPQQPQQSSRRTVGGGVGGAVPNSSSTASMIVLTPSKREQQLSEKLVLFDKTIKDQKQHIHALSNELSRLQSSFSEAESKLHAKEAEVKSLEDATKQALADQKDAADLVTRLLKRIDVLERSHEDKTDRTMSDLQERHDNLLVANADLKQKLTEATMRLKSVEKREVQRLREATLSHISSPTRSSRPKHSNPLRSGPAPEASHSEHPSDSLLQSIKELRIRCAKLETENKDLKLRSQQESAVKNALSIVEKVGGLPQGVHRPSSPDVPDGSSPTMGSSKTPTGRVSSFLEREYLLLKEQVQYFADEVARVQRDKDELQRLLATHPRSVEVSETVRSVAHAIVNGCSSLLVQLQVIETAWGKQDARDRQRALRPSTSPSSAGMTSPTKRNVAEKAMIVQHRDAVHGLKAAVDEIMKRRSTMSDGAVPSIATAPDCEALSHFLTFEVERLTHLRAFLPSFAQLCVAVEHLKLRSSAAGVPVGKSTAPSGTK